MKQNKTIRPPILLKTILDILFWILLIKLIISFGLTLVTVFTDTPQALTPEEYGSMESTTATFTALSIKLILSGIFVYIVYILRKIVRSFFRRKLFTPVQISGLNLAGQLIILVSLGEAALDFFVRLYTTNNARIGLQVEESFGSFWFSLALGMFFILLSKSFRYAKTLKEEQDLTI